MYLELHELQRNSAGTSGTYHIRLLMGTNVCDIARRGAFPLHIFTDVVFI